MALNASECLDTSGISTYSYTPLADNAIRTFVLLETSPPRGKIEVSSFDTVYTAVSYTWADQNGDDTRCKELRIGDDILMITSNLYDGLLRFGPGRYWIDAICINQGDDVERSAQVVMMASIFAHATDTIVWLGKGDERQDRALAALLACVSHDDHHEEQPAHSWHDSCGRVISCCRLNADRDAEVWESLKHEMKSLIDALSSRRYFTRLWTVQEIQHSRRLTVMFGPATISEMSHTGLLHRLPTFKYGISKSFWRACEHLSKPPSYEKRHLYKWLRYTNHLDCKDPRDRVYALLSFDPGCGIAPDYTQTPDALWMKLARYHLKTQGLWTVLQDLHGEKALRKDHSCATLPSWVPGFDAEVDLGTMTSMDPYYMEPIESRRQEGNVDESGRLHCELYRLGHIETWDERSVMIDHRNHKWELDHDYAIPMVQTGDIICCEDEKVDRHARSKILILRPTASAFNAVVVVDLRFLCSWSKIHRLKRWFLRRRALQKQHFIIE